VQNGIERNSISKAVVPVQLGEIQETLLISVYLRALETQRADGMIRDHKTVEIVRSRDYPFSRQLNFCRDSTACRPRYGIRWN
jgi:O-methyltransferase involved in polyketide biosynthesis